MSINFATLQGLSIPEGVVTKIEDASGRVLWELSNGTVILEVEKITSNTYAGETSYADEQFILLDIYPKTNGTVSVTYGGLTKTITDTSGAEEPNAQEVFFGTFNGVTDGVETPASGELVIEGDYYAFGVSTFSSAKGVSSSFTGLTAIKSFGCSDQVATLAFAQCNKLTTVSIPGSIESIGEVAFGHCSALSNVVIKNGIKSIGSGAFTGCTAIPSLYIPKSVSSMGALLQSINKNCIVEIDNENTAYKIDGNGIVEISTKTLIQGFLNTVIPSYITAILEYAFYGFTGLTSITIPNGVTDIGMLAFSGCTGLTSITIPNSVTRINMYAFDGCTGLTSITILATEPPAMANAFEDTTCQIIVPKGCGDTYKAATGWNAYSDRIVEES